LWTSDCNSYKKTVLHSPTGKWEEKSRKHKTLVEPINSNDNNDTKMMLYVQSPNNKFNDKARTWMYKVTPRQSHTPSSRSSALSRRGSCKCLFAPQHVPSTPSQSICQCIS